MTPFSNGMSKWPRPGATHRRDVMENAQRKESKGMRTRTALIAAGISTVVAVGRRQRLRGGVVVSG